MQTNFDFLKATVKPPKLQTYTDYREYLQDFYQYKKKLFKNEIRGYTYAHFSAAANIKSPNYLKLIIDGKRNLSKEMIQKFSRALELNKEDSLEFKA
ncbi:MAG: TIGR02147 family protein, partial [Bdellovibrionales bacterium]|nr:TIGR02147 family protein [Bdellovibrionales bacterium]